MASVACNIHDSGSLQHNSRGVLCETESCRNDSTASDTPSRHSSTSPGNRSRSFSISDILSDDMGSRKRSSNSNPIESKVKQPKLGYGIVSTDNNSKIFPSQPAQTLLSPVNMYSALHQQVRSLTEWPSTKTSSIPSQVYPVSYPSTVHLKTSPTSVPVSYPSYPLMANTYVPNLAAQMQHYYQMHVQAAQFQQQMMAVQQQQQQQQQQNSLLSNSTRHQDQMIKMNSRPTSNINRHDNYENSADENTILPQFSTPILLKNKRKPTKPCLTSQNTPTNSSSNLDDQQHHHQTYPKPYYSRSPLKPPNTTFSPSIFLTRPNTSSISRTPTNTSSSECADVDREVGPMSSNLFMTSTPIRRGEKMSFVSPHTHSPISSGGKEDCSTPEHQSGSDSEVPLLRRPRVPRKRTKSRVMSSSYVSLAENANCIPPVIVSSSRHTPSHPPPSSLLMSYTAPGTAVQHSFSVNNDSGFISDTSTHKPSTQQENTTNQYSNRCHQFNVSPENIFKTPVKNLYNIRQGNNVKYPDAWGSSPFTDHLKKTGQIQSVPPWFVCSDKRSNGKRLRLTEAINKSLMETPSQATNQLPAEWQKFAYGLTDDQKDLTQKARSFLRCRPRVLQFEKTSSE